MARPSKTRKREQRAEARAGRAEERRLFEMGRRVICETCGQEQEHVAAPGHVDGLAPCIGPLGMGGCPGETCVTVEAYAEATGSLAALALIRHGHGESLRVATALAAVPAQLA